jgi:protein-disulfide isomerase
MPFVSRSLLVLSLIVAGCAPTAESKTPDGTAPPVIGTAAGTGGITDDLPDPVATIGDQTITASEFDDKTAAEVAKAREQLYEARKQALDQMVAEKLLDAEATKRGVTRDDLVKTEVQDKVPQPSEEEISAFYEQNKARIRQPLEQVHDQVAQHLSQQKMQDGMSAFLDTLKKDKPVKIYLEPPRFAIAVPEGEPRKGLATAPIQIVEFSDFQCPYCNMAADTVRQVETKYGDKVSVVYRNFPLPMHRRAHPAAEAAECANEQGKFWEYHDQLFANQRQSTDDDFATFAQTAGLDVTKFKDCYASGKYKDAVDADIHDGEKVGMSGTPGFYINGRMLSGAQPIEAFSDVIDDELAKVN